MKIVCKLLAIFTLVVSSYTTKAQVATPSKPQLFSRFSNKLPTPVTELGKAFEAKVGSRIEIAFSNLDFTGIITSSVKRYDNLYSVVIKSTSLDNALLSISKRINDDKTITYVGRLINQDYADGYELVKDNEGNYALNKIQTNDLLQDQ
ncbi:MAG: hypothetical protein Q8891_05480 [Bacteroidota bacterium]|jgi:hypothetical protein|nr:hypothetical protein [Bacteroidota bacterium]